MRIAERAYSLAQEQNDPALIMGANRALACTFYFFGNFDTARKYAISGVEIFRLGGLQSPIQESNAPAVSCLCFKALTEWHFGEIVSCQTSMAEAISLAKELNFTYPLALALHFAAHLAYFEGDAAQVERLASDLIELSTRQNFVLWLAIGTVLRGWARSVAGDTAEGISLIKGGIEDFRATGAMLTLPYWLALQAEVFHLADRTHEALDAIEEAAALVERSEERWCCAELHRLRGVFLVTIRAESQIEASFCEAIRTAKRQKSVSLEKRAEASYAEYCRQKGERVRGARIAPTD